MTSLRLPAWCLEAAPLWRALLVIGAVLALAACGSESTDLDQGLNANQSLSSKLAVPGPSPPTLSGLDRFASGEVPIPEGRLGLVVHSASLTLTGKHAIDVFLDGGGDLVRLFSPEHGLRGQAAAGEHVASEVDPGSGLALSSLYGATKKPSPESLRDVDTLIFDLQGGGVRFYTYVSTLLLCLEAAAENGVRLLILDRPNLLGGLTVGGPLSAERTTVAESFVNMAPGPLIHGMTLGEVARLANHRRAHAGESPADLQVLPMLHWARSMTWRDTARAWVNPSPNLRSPEAALLYPGTALFEGTNVSEGRGTSEVFQQFGAPWFDDELIEALLAIKTDGIELQETLFVPGSSPAAPSPKYEGQTCRGIAVRPVGATFEPFSLGVQFLATLASHPDFHLSEEGRSLTWLVGDPSLAEHLSQPDALATTQEWLLSLEAENLVWLDQRRPFLLY